MIRKIPPTSTIRSIWRAVRRIYMLILELKGLRTTRMLDSLFVIFYSQSTSRLTSISENEMDIRISLCNVQHVNGMLNFSLEIFPKKTH